MVRSIHKINTTIILTSVTLLAVIAFLTVGGIPVGAADTGSVTFNVNLKEVLTVSIDNPASWASGEVDSLLRNKVTVTALTNNYNGAHASMYANAKTLNNTATYSASDTSSYIDTLTATTYTHDTFPTNAWGYSLTDTEVGVGSASYLPIVTSADAVTILDTTIGSSGSKDVFFGAKASSAKQSGTYAQTVNFAVVTGTVDTTPIPVVDPSHDETSTDVAVHHDTVLPSAPEGRTVYTSRTYRDSAGNVTNANTANTSRTTTTVTNGNAVSSYANAAGVTSTTTGGSSALAVALGVAAGVTAVSGVFFFVLAKRKKDEDEEED